MAAPQNFRSAFSGFHKEDVIHYLEYLNTKHAAEVAQLQQENEALRAENAQLLERPVLTPAIANELENLRALVAQLEQEKAALQEALEQASVQPAQPTVVAAEPAVVAEPVAAVPSNQELEAYRRAERVEREARERAAQIYHRTNGALAEAAVKVDEAAAQIDQMANIVSSQLTDLRDLVSGSKQVLHDAASAMYTLRPEEE
jgi:DNA repair exonuclease SbcCD ATPase subunit